MLLSTERAHKQLCKLDSVLVQAVGVGGQRVGLARRGPVVDGAQAQLARSDLALLQEATHEVREMQSVGSALFSRANGRVTLR